MKENDILNNKWDESYKRQENFIFYPKDETVKFLNRFVRKRSGVNSFIDVLDSREGLKGLDFGCGIGRATLLMREFGIDARGIDISSVAIETAKTLAASFNYSDMHDKFLVVQDARIPFADNFFDVTLSEGVLDSMYFEIAKTKMKEIDRVTSRLAFISLISGDNDRHGNSFEGEEIVKTRHEEGTVQTYYSMEKINRLLNGTKFKIRQCYVVTESSEMSNYSNSRYYLVLGKE